MKKYLILLFVAIAFSFSSCQEEVEPGGTAVQDMAGDWWVTYQSSMEEYDFLFGGTGAMPSEETIDDWTWDYVYSDATTAIQTYNTNANDPDKMYVNDHGLYWDYEGIVNVNYAAKTFECDSIANIAYDSGFKIIGGKILKGAAKSPSGNPVDSIVFYIRFYDDTYGFTYTKVSGFRRTGFGADDF